MGVDFLLIPQHDHGVDSRRAIGRNQAGDRRDERNEHGKEGVLDQVLALIFTNKSGKQQTHMVIIGQTASARGTPLERKRSTGR